MWLSGQVLKYEVYKLVTKYSLDLVSHVGDVSNARMAPTISVPMSISPARRLTMAPFAATTSTRRATSTSFPNP